MDVHEKGEVKMEGMSKENGVERREGKDKNKENGAEKREREAPYGLPMKRGTDRFQEREWKQITAFIASRIWDQEEPVCSGE